MRIRDEYLHGSDLTGVVKKIEVTIGTGNNANQSVIKYIKADSEGGVVEVPIGDITGKAATALKLDNTSAIGSTTNPVYFTANGVPSACTYSLNATVPVGAANKVLYYSAQNTLDVQSYTTLTSNLDIFTAATSSAAGKKGLVPAPSANQLGAGNFFLRADGVWTVIENKSAALNGTATSLVTTGEKYNWNSAYNWYNTMTSGDTDGVINKWKEVEAFLANYGDSSTLAAELAKLVTLSTNQTITGVKTFSEVINGSITGNADTVDGYHATNFSYNKGDANYDCNDLPHGTHSATYRFSSTPINAFPDAAYGNLLVIGSGADTVTQIGAPYNKDNLYFRCGTWYSDGGSIRTNTWKAILHSENYNSYAPKLDGTGASGTWGIDISGNADTVDGYHAVDFGRTTKIELPVGLVLRIDMRNQRGLLINIQGPNLNRNALYFITGYGRGTIDRNNIRVIKDGNYDVYFNGTSENSGCAYIVRTNPDWIGNDYIFINFFDSDSVLYTIVSSVPSDAVLVSSSKENILATLNSNVASSSKWETARSITLTGAVTGNASIDGSNNVSLVTTVNHTHTKSEITDFPTSLPASDVYAWAKLATKPSYSWSEILSKPTTIDGYGITDALTKRYIVLKLDYQRYVILLCKIGTNTTNTHHTINGTFWTTHDGSGRYTAAYINVHCSDWLNNHNEYYGFTPFGLDISCRLVTCTYQSDQYLAITFERITLCYIYFDGSYSNILFTPILYYTSNTSTINNSEIYNSISEVTSYNKLAFTTDNVASATKLQTARTIWGQSFDGTGNISGSLSNVVDVWAGGVIYSNKYNGSGNSACAAFVLNKGVDYFGIGPSSGSVSNVGFGICTIDGTWKNELMTITNDGNVGIGITTPSWKLHVVGDIYTTTGFKKEGSSDSYVLLGGGGHKTESSLSVNYAASAGNANTLGTLDKTRFLRQEYVPNNTENDFNTFSNMTLTGRGDPTTGASLKNAPWTGVGPAGGYGVLTYLWSSYGIQMACGYNSNRIYIRSNYYNGSLILWQTTWYSIALTSDIPTKVSQLTNDAKYLTSHAYSYGSIDIYDINGAKKTSNNTVSASVNTETLRLQEGANIAITATNSGTSGSDNIKIAVTGITSNIDRNGYGQLALWNNGASSVSTTLQSATFNDTLIVKAGSGIDFSGVNGTANNDIWTISAIPYNCAITLNTNSTKSLIKDSWSTDALSVYLTSNGTSSGTSLAAGTYALWIEDRSSSSGTPNYYSGTFTCAGSATAGRLDEIALHSSMATSADTNAPTRIFVATQISSTSGKHVLRFCSLDSKATPHYLTVKVNRII